MPLVPAKCTNCGANLTIDSTKDAAICEYCHTPFVTEKAINNYNPLGTATFIIAYVTAADFGGFWERYTNYLVNYQFHLA